jgi:CheY-like chemotaxis protein
MKVLSMASEETSMPRIPRILVIDDNQADLDLFSEAIGELGEQVDCRTAQTVDDGIMLIESGQKAGALPPALIILDLHMPGHDGKHLLRHLRSRGDLPAIPVVVLSSSNWDRDREECLKLGASHYRVKPQDWLSYRDLIAFLRPFWTPPAVQRAERLAT